MKKLLLFIIILIISLNIFSEALTESRQQESYKLIQSLSSAGNVCIGMNESIKAVNSGRALLVNSFYTLDFLD